MPLDDLKLLHTYAQGMLGAAWLLFVLLAAITRAAFLVPVMTCYAAAYGWYLLAAWDPSNAARFIPVETALLALRAVAGLEALLLVVWGAPSEEKRSLMMLLTAVGMLFIVVTQGIGHGEGTLLAYRTVKWQVSIALGGIALVAGLCARLYPVRGIGGRYAACFACLLVMQAAQVVWFVLARTGGTRMWLVVGAGTMAVMIPAVVGMGVSLISFRRREHIV